ncbi:MAG TPA: hypothetical protein VEG64_02190 [Candidatus Sulfotelmatobacter sp.]|nr:hypothetical protein [Candidatus Sulfotelmatobacter sp.]
MGITPAQLKSFIEGGGNDDFQTVAKALEQIIENISAQTKINAAVVARLLALEQKIDALTKRGPQRGSTNKRSMKAPTMLREAK